jgi:hypothetical protein
MRFISFLILSSILLTACGPGPLASQPALNINAQTKVGDLQVFYEESAIVDTLNIEQAIIEGNLEAVRRYVKTHDSLRIENIRGSTTLLHLAIAHEQYEILSFLLTQEKYWDLLDGNSQTPLYKAQSFSMLEKLLGKGLSPFTPTSNTTLTGSYFEWLAYQNEWVLLDVIVKHPYTKKKAQELKNTLLEVVTQKATFKYLIDIGCDLSTPLADGSSILGHYPVYTDPEMIQWAIKAGANPNLKNNQRETPLMKVDFLESFQYLVEHGARLSVEGVSAQELIQHHIKAEHTDIVNYLLENHSQAFKLDPLLVQAIENLDYRSIKSLLKAGARPDAYEFTAEDPFRLNYRYPGDKRIPAVLDLLRAT